MWKKKTDKVAEMGTQPSEMWECEAKFDLLGPVGETLFRPTCVSVSQTGEFVLTDSDSCFVVIYNSSGAYMTHFSTIPKRLFYIFIDNEKFAPHDVAWLASKRIVYTQPKGCRVLVSDWTGKLSVTIEGRPLYHPYGVCVDNTDKIYVTDKEKGRILCFNTEGKLLRGIGMFASGDILHEPHYITVTEDGTIYVNEIYNGQVRVHVFSKTGNYNIKTVDNSKKAGCLSVDMNGDILQVDTNKSCITKYKSQNFRKWHDMEHSQQTMDTIELLHGEFTGITVKDNNQLVCIDHKNKQMKLIHLNSIETKN